MSESQLRKRIEQLRNQMIDAALKKESFVDAEVVTLSQRLDGFINQLQMLKQKNNMNTSVQKARVS